MVKLGAESAASVIKEMLDPNKITSQHLSSEGGRRSWENATQQEHETTTGKEATNDNEERSLGSITLQIDFFSTIEINHSFALALVRYNKDFFRNEVELCKQNKKNKTTAPIGEQGNLFNINLYMYQYLLQTDLQLKTGVQ